MPLICFTSPKGGVGKTTLAANVAANIARSGRPVIALDLDPQNALRLHFGVPLTDRNSFVSLLAQAADWRSSVRYVTYGVGLLPYGTTDKPSALQLASRVMDNPILLAGPVSQMLSDPRVCVVADTSPGPSSLLAALLPVTDFLVTILLVDAASVSLIPALESGATYGTTKGPRPQVNHGFVLNQANPRTRLGNQIIKAASRHLGSRLLGIVYQDQHVAEAIAAQKPLAHYAPSAKATHDVEEITRAILVRLDPTHTNPVTKPIARRPRWLHRWLPE